MANNTNELNIQLMEPHDLARWAVPKTELETLLLSALKQFTDETNPYASVLEELEEVSEENQKAQDELGELRVKSDADDNTIAELEQKLEEKTQEAVSLEADKVNLESEAARLEKALAEALLKIETNLNPEEKEQNPMTIEALLSEQNDLLRELIAKISTPLGAPAAPEKVAPKKSAEKPAASQPTTTSETPSSGQASSTGASTTSSAAAAETAETPKVTYDDAKAAVTALVKAQGRDAGLAVLAEFKTDSLLNVPEAEWPAVITACEEAMKEKALA